MQLRERHNLTIVIPALDEELAIGGTIERCLQARQEICEYAGIQSVEIIVVSDGSTDKTPEIAKSYKEVKVIVFEKNRGYGAAIKTGFEEGTGSLVGFIDADGTCDPRIFAKLCDKAIRASADVVLGSRMAPENKMPKIRRLGNRIYAFLLGALCGKLITDTASGMRVIRRSSLELLYPLPDGLHFTPSMSAKALMSGLRIEEVPMPYEERIGRSKLSVLRDGIRFFQAIFDAVLCFCPEKIFNYIALGCAAFSALLAVHPTEFYLKQHQIEEWMIYRFIVCTMIAFLGYLSMSVGAIAYRMSAFSKSSANRNLFWPSLMAGVFEGRPSRILSSVLFVSGTLLLWPAITEYLSTMHITLHWSRFMVGCFCYILGGQVVLTNILMKVMVLWMEQFETQADKKRILTTETSIGRRIADAA